MKKGFKILVSFFMAVAMLVGISNLAFAEPITAYSQMINANNLNILNTQARITLTQNAPSATFAVAAGVAGRVPITVVAPATGSVTITSPGGTSDANDPALFNASGTRIAFQNFETWGFTHTVPAGTTFNGFIGTGGNVARTFIVNSNWSAAQPSNFIWHSDADRVAFWPGAVNVYNRTLGAVAPTFNFNAQITHARNQWSNALGIPIGTATYANAQIQGFGGQRAAVDAFRGTGPSTWAGLAQWSWFNHATISVAGRQRTVHRMATARIFTIDLPGWTGESHRRMSTMITTHELGHALGWDGHPPRVAANDQDVMWWQAHQNYSLRQTEIRHLRQIYDFYR